MNDTDARRRNHWVSHIARHAHEKPGGVYLRFEGGSVTWAQIHERVSGLAAALRERGVKAGALQIDAAESAAELDDVDGPTGPVA